MRTEFEMEKIIHKQKVLDRIHERQDWDNFWKNIKPSKLIELKKIKKQPLVAGLGSFAKVTLKTLKS